MLHDVDNLYYTVCGGDSMPALEETQRPFLERDKANDLVPQRGPQESFDAYCERLAALYCVSTQVVRNVIMS
jgi:hypothetical protein